MDEIRSLPSFSPYNSITELLKRESDSETNLKPSTPFLSSAEASN